MLNMHLAAGACVLGIFGVSDPQRTAPRGPRAHCIGDHHAWPDCDAVHMRLLRLIDAAVREDAS